MRHRRTFRNEEALADQMAQVPESPLKPYKDLLKKMAEGGPPEPGKLRVARPTFDTDDRDKVNEHKKNFKKAAKEMHMEIQVMPGNPLPDHKSYVRVYLLSCPAWPTASDSPDPVSED